MFAANAQFESVPMLPLAAAVSIGDISLALDGLSVDDVDLGSGLQAFCCENGDPNIEVSVSWAGGIRSRSVAPAFDSGAVCTLFQDESHLVFDFSSPALGTHPYKRLV